MAGNNSPRARARRSSNTAGTEQHQDALSLISDGLEDIVTTLIDKSKGGDVQAAKALLSLQSEEFSRSRSGANDPLLIKLKEIREAGSAKQAELWGRLYAKIPVIETA